MATMTTSTRTMPTSMRTSRERAAITRARAHPRHEVGRIVVPEAQGARESRRGVTNPTPRLGRDALKAVGPAGRPRREVQEHQARRSREATVATSRRYHVIQQRSQADLRGPSPRTLRATLLATHRCHRVRLSCTSAARTRSVSFRRANCPRQASLDRSPATDRRAEDQLPPASRSRWPQSAGTPLAIENSGSP